MTTLLFALVVGVKGWAATQTLYCFLPAGSCSTCYTVMSATEYAEMLAGPHPSGTVWGAVQMDPPVRVDNPCPRCGLGGVAVGVERHYKPMWTDSVTGMLMQDAAGWLMIRYVCPRRHTFTAKAIPVDRNDDKGGK